MSSQAITGERIKKTILCVDLVEEIGLDLATSQIAMSESAILAPSGASRDRRF